MQGVMFGVALLCCSSTELLASCARDLAEVCCASSQGFVCHSSAMQGQFVWVLKAGSVCCNCTLLQHRTAGLSKSATLCGLWERDKPMVFVAAARCGGRKSFLGAQKGSVCCICVLLRHRAAGWSISATPVTGFDECDKPRVCVTQQRNAGEMKGCVPAVMALHRHNTQMLATLPVSMVQ